MRRARKKHVETERRWAVVAPGGATPEALRDWFTEMRACSAVVLFSSREDAHRYLATFGPANGRVVLVEVTVREI